MNYLNKFATVSGIVIITNLFLNKPNNISFNEYIDIILKSNE